MRIAGSGPRVNGSFREPLTRRRVHRQAARETVGHVHGAFRDEPHLTSVCLVATGIPAPERQVLPWMGSTGASQAGPCGLETGIEENAMSVGRLSILRGQGSSPGLDPSGSGGGAPDPCARKNLGSGRHGRGLGLVTGLSLLLLVLALSALPSRAQSSGHWELVRTESLGQDIPTPAARYRNREFYEGSSANGRVEGHHTVYYDASRDTLTNEIAGQVTWTPPPGRAGPGDSWDGAYAATVTRDYSMYRASGLEQTWTLTVDTCHRFVPTPSGVGRGYWNQPVGLFKTSDPRTAVPAKTSVFRFPDPKDSSAANPWLVVQVNVQLSMGGSDNYNYYYKWVQDGPREVKGHLRCVARNSHNGAVAGLVCKFRNLEDGKTFQVTTGQNGEVKTGVRAVTRSGKIRVRLEGVEIDSKTRYALPLEGTVPSFVRSGQVLSRALKRDFELTEKNRFMLEVPIQVPLVKVSVLPLRWDSARDRWQRVPCHVLVRGADGAKLLQCGIDACKGSGNTLALDLHLPTAEFFKNPEIRLFGFEPSQRLTDTRSFVVPSAKGPSTVSVVTLQLCDTAARIVRLKFQVYNYFLPLVGEERARRIAEVRVDTDPAAGSISYLDGVIRIPGGTDLNQDESSETFMHEWTHHLMSILGPDPEVEGLLGGAHDVWTRAGNPELAWDEGRAHFVAAVLSQGLKLPRNARAFTRAGAQGRLGANPDAGDRVEGVVTVALLDLYSTSGFKKTAEVMGSFLGVNDLAIATLGHPPRTSAEFFRTHKAWLEAERSAGRLDSGTASRLLKTADEVRRKYQVGP